MSDEFFLAWEDFEQNMATRFQQILQNEEFVVTLVSGDNVQIKAHKIILNTGSGLFRSVLSENAHHHPIIYLRVVTQEVLHALVDFLYLGQVKIQQHFMKSFMDTTLDLDIHGLKYPDMMNRHLPSLVENQDDQAKHDKIVEGSFWEEFSMIPDFPQEDLKNHPKDIDVKLNSTEDQNESEINYPVIDKFTSIKNERQQKIRPKRSSIKVKRFKPSWLDMYCDSVKAGNWLKADPIDETRGVCMVCPPKHGLTNCSFNINEGWAAIQQHNYTEKHKQALKDIILM